MPKQTFFNLPEEKRERLIHAAIEEFAGNPFQKAVIDNITKKAGISKGSFYQYFENKEDIYRYLFESISIDKTRHLHLLLREMNHIKFSTFIRRFYEAGVDFEYTQEEYEAFHKRFLLNCSKELRDEILETLTPQSNQLFETVLSFYKENGELKEDLDISFTAEMLTALTMFISTRTMAGNALDRKAEVTNAIEGLLRIIETGIKTDLNDKTMEE